MIDIAQALQHPTEDQDWIKKFALGVLISFVPILSFAVTGFIIEHLQNSARGASSPLPNWDNLGKKLVTGLKLLAVQLIFALPILVPSCALLGFVIQQTASRPGENLPENAVLIVGIGGIALSCIALIYGLFLLYLSAAILNPIRQDRANRRMFAHRRADPDCQDKHGRLLDDRRNSRSYFFCCGVGLRHPEPHLLPWHHYLDRDLDTVVAIHWAGGGQHGRPVCAQQSHRLTPIWA